MCGRFTQRHPKEDIAERFDVPEAMFFAEIRERYNVAPSQTIPAIVQEAEGERALVGFKWGLVPRWAKDPAVGNRMINAKAETLAEKPSFKQALQKRRCLIPADGFYEWKKDGKAKQPLYIRKKDESLFAFAGLWEEWSPPGGETLRTCTIITTEPNELLSTIHHRMAAILLPEEEALWLNPESGVEAALRCLRPYPLSDLERVPVSKAVNSPRVDAPSCIEPMSAGA